MSEEESRISSIDIQDRERIDQLAQYYLSGPSGSRIDYLDLDSVFEQPASPIVVASRAQPSNMTAQPASLLSPTAPALLQAPAQSTEPTLPVVQARRRANNRVQHRTTGRTSNRVQHTNVPVNRNYVQNITTKIVHMSCREFKRDILCKKRYRNECKKLSVSWKQFLALLRQIQQDYHINNNKLRTVYLKPQDDNQRREKYIFAQYFNYFLRNNLEATLFHSKVKDKDIYMNYALTYLMSLGTIGNLGDIRQDNRTR